MNITEHGHRGAAPALSRAARAEPIGGPNPAGRDSPAGSFFLALAACLALSACVAPTLRIEAEHISHPMAGWPVGPADEEAQITQMSALLHWQRGPWYASVGVGVKVYEKTPWDFVGPDMTGTVRIGREFRLVTP